jgi:hypothetical protein
MEHYAGIDVSLELSSVCIVDAKGKIVKEAKVPSDPDALVVFFRHLGFPVARIGLEAGPLSQWLHAGLSAAGKVGRAATCVTKQRRTPSQGWRTFLRNYQNTRGRHRRLLRRVGGPPQHPLIRTQIRPHVA